MQPKFDGEIVTRTSALTTILGYFVGSKLGWPSEVTSACGFFIGMFYDFAAFALKRWQKERTQYRGSI